MSSRLADCFAELKQHHRAALITYICAGDPDYESSLRLLHELPAAGADIIELGMPFSDPMADGPVIQSAALRALQGGQTQQRTLQMVRSFRQQNQHTPLVLMGYYNPVYRYGSEAFLHDAQAAGVDGLLIVDLPPEHDDELGPLARELGLDLIRMASPTTDERRLPQVLAQASGFLYYVSMNGVTGSANADHLSVAPALARIRQYSNLPLCVGFGVRTAGQVAALAGSADGVVVGSALVDCLAAAGSSDQGIQAVLSLTRQLAEAIPQRSAQ